VSEELAEVVVLTGAGISAESGVPTFRGAAGLWRTYRPEDLATLDAFRRDPTLVWEWWQPARAGTTRQSMAYALHDGGHRSGGLPGASALHPTEV